MTDFTKLADELEKAVGPLSHVAVKDAAQALRRAAKMEADARDMFDSGFLACWAKMAADNREAPFVCDQAELDNAWRIYQATKDEA